MRAAVPPAAALRHHSNKRQACTACLEQGFEAGVVEGDVRHDQGVKGRHCRAGGGATRRSAGRRTVIWAEQPLLQRSQRAQRCVPATPPAPAVLKLCASHHRQMLSPHSPAEVRVHGGHGTPAGVCGGRRGRWEAVTAAEQPCGSRAQCLPAPPPSSRGPRSWEAWSSCARQGGGWVWSSVHVVWKQGFAAPACNRCRWPSAQCPTALPEQHPLVVALLPREGLLS